MISSFHLESLLVMAYAMLLMAIAAGLEWMAKHAHKRSGQYQTGGFRFHRDRDIWECPVGLALIRAEIDHEHGVVRYRAPAHACNNCQIKSRCTHSDRGREIAVPLDPWGQSASLRLQRGISCVLLTVAVLALGIELFRHNRGVEQWILGLLLLVVVWRFASLVSRLNSRRGGTVSARPEPHGAAGHPR